jgi:hypothetical protein
MPYFVSLRHLIREMSVANPLWGAPRIRGELLKLGIDVGQTTVANEKAAAVARLGRPSFAITPDGIASIDLSVVPVSAAVWTPGLAAFAAGAFVIGRDGI